LAWDLNLHICNLREINRRVALLFFQFFLWSNIVVIAGALFASLDLRDLLNKLSLQFNLGLVTHYEILGFGDESGL
jgi:hypothetical protein